MFYFFLCWPFPGEYITLYQTQRNALKSYYKDRERLIAQLSSEKANMQVSMFVYLRPLFRKLKLVNLLFHFPYYHMTRTAPRAFSLENHRKKVLV